MGNFKYYGDSDLLAKETESDMNEKDLPGYTKDSSFSQGLFDNHDSSAVSGKVNYNFQSDEMSTSL